MNYGCWQFVLLNIHPDLPLRGFTVLDSLCFWLKKVINLTTTRGQLTGECKHCHSSMWTNCRCYFSDDDSVSSTVLSFPQQLNSSVVGSQSVIWLFSDSTSALTSFSLQTTFHSVSCIVPSYYSSGFPFILLYVSEMEIHVVINSSLHQCHWVTLQSIWHTCQMILIWEDSSGNWIAIHFSCWTLSKINTSWL